MANTVKIKLDTSQYKAPTQEDITSAKEFILRRNEFASILEEKVEWLLDEAAELIVAICYKYNVDPKKFEISSKYNAQMMAEISAVMDELEEELLDYISEYSTRVTNDRSHMTALLAWLLLLGRDNRDLRGTLEEYLHKTMKDWEAAIAALRYADVSMTDAVTKIKSNLRSIYTMPEVKEAFKEYQTFAAIYIQSRGTSLGRVGLSNNGSVNVINMAKTTLQMAWMREQAIVFKEEGAEGYYQLRGSQYPCDICDSEVGFHKGIEGLYSNPYPHPHCCCYRIPIYPKNTKLT